MTYNTSTHSQLTDETPVLTDKLMVWEQLTGELS